jgi:uncharacterized protein (TIGR02147 family)
MGLSKSEAEFFENLVNFNQSSNFKERTFYFEKLNTVLPKNVEASSARQLREDQYEFYSQWYNVALRSLIDLHPSIRDPKILSKMVYPLLTAKQVQKSLDLLVRLGLIVVQPDGGFQVSSKMLTTGPDLQKLAVQQFHIACMGLAEKALVDLPSDKRNFSGVTLGISQEAYRKISEELVKFQRNILSIAENDSGSDMVYQFNFHLFPMSAINKNVKVSLSNDRVAENILITKKKFKRKSSH